MPSEVFPVSALSVRALIFIVGMGALPGVVTYVALRSVGAASPGVMALGVSAISLPIFALLLMQLFLVKVVLTPHSLHVGGGLYKIEVPIEALEVERMRVSDGHKGLARVDSRVNGIGMPGLSLGWFVGAGRKYFIAAGQGRNRIFIPTLLDYDIIIAPDDPERFVEALNTAAAIETGARN